MAAETEKEKKRQLWQHEPSSSCFSYLFSSMLICFALTGVFYSFLKEKQLSNLHRRLTELEERVLHLEYLDTDEEISPLPQWYSDGALKFTQPTLDASPYRILPRSKRNADPGRRGSSRSRSRSGSGGSSRRIRILPTRRPATRRPATPYPTQPTFRTPYPTQPRLPTRPPSPVPPVQPRPPSPVPPLQPRPPSPIPPIQPPRPGYPSGPGYPSPGYPSGAGYPRPGAGYPQPGIPTGIGGGKKKKKGTLNKIGKAVAVGAGVYLGAKVAKKGLKMVGKLGRSAVTSMLLPHHRFRVKSHRKMKIDLDGDNMNIYGFNGVTAAAHYVGYTPGAEKRVEHSEEMFRNWTKSFWMDPLNMDNSFRLDRGAVTVLESGLYLLYAQVHYVEKQFISGFKLFVDDEPVAQCVTMATTNLTATKHNTCFTSTLTFIGEHSRVYLAEIEEPRTSVLDKQSTFFGLINLGDPRTVLLQDYSRVDWD